MSSSVVKVNGVEVTSDASKPTIINININQPSTLSCLLESAKSAWKGRKSAKNDTEAATFGGEQKVLGAVQIMIGLICVSFAVILCFVGESNMFWNGSGFWTGFPKTIQEGSPFPPSKAWQMLRRNRSIPICISADLVPPPVHPKFILTGVLSILAEKRASCLWLYAASLLNLVSLGLAIGGLYVLSFDLNLYGWSGRWSSDELCKPQQEPDYGRSYETMVPEASNWRVENCKNVFGALMNLFNGMKIMVLVATCLALCIAVYSLGYGCKTLICPPSCEQDEEEFTSEKDTEPLLSSHPPPYAEKCAKVETI